MKNTPSSPLFLPGRLNLGLNPGPAQEQTSAKGAEPARSPRRKPKKKSARSKRSARAAGRAESETRWHRVKGRLAATAAQVDPEKLKPVLLACCVAAGIVAAVIIAIKLLPAMALILAILGLGAALRFWDSLRFLPRPF